MSVVFDNIGMLLRGFVLTLELTVVGFIGALIIGTLAACARVSPVAPLRTVAWIYTEFFKNIPMLCLLTLFIFGLPDAGVLIGLAPSAMICFALGGGAFVAEAVRSGINSVHIGQAEAARAIGLTFTQTIANVIIPQALRSMIPPLVSVAIGIALGSSLAGAVGVPELTNQTQQLNIKYAEAVASFIFSGAMYIALALAIAGAGRVIEGRVGKAVRR